MKEAYINEPLWQKILNFDLDNPLSPYGFSTRLSKEHKWTKSFTQKAILEYKKFMYLACTSDKMISPCEIVDKVWHQHIIFTESYTFFCNIIGKQIHHIPSNHSKKQQETLSLAAQETREQYINVFGNPPQDIWNHADMLDSLGYAQAKYSLISIIAVSILAFPTLVLSFYLLLRPYYIRINNPYFVIAFFLLAGISITLLELYNRSYLEKLTKSWDSIFVLHNLQPTELIYLKSSKRENIIHPLISKLIETGHISITPSQKLKFEDVAGISSPEEYTILQTLKEYGTIGYEQLLTTLVRQPVFTAIYDAMNAIRAYFINSLPFRKLFYRNIGCLLVLLTLGYVRLITGIVRDKPITIICLVLLATTLGSVIFLYRLTYEIGSKLLLKLYQQKVAKGEIDHNRWDWNYYFVGTSALVIGIIPLIEGLNSRYSSGGDSSSCSSSCGSSCGGCGGGD